MNDTPPNWSKSWANFIGLCRWGNSHGSNRLRASDLPFSMVCGGIVPLMMVFDFEPSKELVKNNEPTNSTKSWTNFIALCLWGNCTIEIDCHRRNHRFVWSEQSTGVFHLFTNAVWPFKRKIGVFCEWEIIYSLFTSSKVLFDLHLIQSLFSSPCPIPIRFRLNCPKRNRETVARAGNAWYRGPSYGVCTPLGMV